MLQLVSKNFYVNGRGYELFLEGMCQHSYDLGRDFVLEGRYADGDVGRLPGLG